MTGNPYLGILAAMLAGGLMNLMFGYLVITRKANQLASGLSMMFFGFGLSALIGKDFVGVKITALPRLLLPGLSSLPRLYTSLFKFDMLDHSGRPDGLPGLVAAVPHPLGTGVAGSGRECRYCLRFRAKSAVDALPGALRRRAAGWPGSGAPGDCLHHELDPVHDRWASALLPWRW